METKELGARLCQRLATARDLQKRANADGGSGDSVKETKVNIEEAAKTGVVSDIQKDTFKNERGDLPGAASDAATEKPDTGAQQGLDAAAVVKNYDPANTDAEKVLGASTTVIKTASDLMGRVEAIAGMTDTDVDAAMAKYASADFQADQLDPQEALQVCENALVKMASIGFEPAQQLMDFVVAFDRGVQKKASDVEELMRLARTNEHLQKLGAAEDPAVAAAILNNAAEQNPIDVLTDPATGELIEGVAPSDLPEAEQAALVAAEAAAADQAAAGADETAAVDGATAADIDQAAAIQAVQELGQQLEAEAEELTLQVAQEIKAADPNVSDEEALDVATAAVTDAITATVAEQAGGIQLEDGSPLVPDENFGVAVDAMEKTASDFPARAGIVGYIKDRFGLDSSAFENRAAAYLSARGTQK